MKRFLWHKLLDASERRRKRGEEYSNLTLSNDFIFFKVMQNEELCRKLLEVILGREIRKLQYHETQKLFKKSYHSKGIWLDVYLEDLDGTVYDIEMQVGKLAELPKRSRYYQGLIDVENTPKGIKYNKLKQSYVIFICMEDVFKSGRYMYTFENVCLEDRNIHLNDGTKKIFLNASAFDDCAEEELKEFLLYLHKGIPTSEFTQRLDEEVCRVKNNEKWRRNYMTLFMRYETGYDTGYETGYETGYDDGMEKGMEKGRELVAEKDRDIAEKNRIIAKLLEENEALKAAR